MGEMVYTSKSCVLGSHSADGASNRHLFLFVIPNTKGMCNVQCANCQRYEHTKKLLPSQTEMRQIRRWPLDKTVPPNWKIEWCSMCPPWWKLSCKLQGMYGLQGPRKKTYPLLQHKTNKPYTIHSRSTICSNNQTQFLHSHKYRARATHKPISSANQRYTGIEKYDVKPFWTNGNYAKPPQNRVYSTEIMAKFLQLAFWNTNGLTQQTEELTT
jgi:hypothetical protein